MDTYNKLLSLYTKKVECSRTFNKIMTSTWYSNMVVVQRLKGDSYVLAEIDRSWSKLRFAAFQLVLYHACDRQSIPLTWLINKNIKELIDKTHEPDKFPEQVHNNSHRSNWWGHQYQNYPLVIEIRCLSISQIPSTSTLFHYSSDNNTLSIVFISILFFDQTYFFCYLIWLFCLLFVGCFIVLLVAAWLTVAREYLRSLL